MIVRFAAVVPAAALLLAMLAHAAGAQTPSPSPSPAPTPPAFSAHAHANVSVVAQDKTYAGSIALGVAQLGNRTRVDLLSVKSDAFPVPPVTATAVIDRGANTITVWSDTTKLYYVQPFLARPKPSASPKPSGSPKPSPSPRAVVRGTSPFAKLDVFEMTVKLIGHTTTAGLPTTGMAFDLRVQNKGDKAVSHVTATVQMADEYFAFPVSLDASIEPGAAPFSAKISYAVDDLTRTLPPASRFEIPAGYAEAKSLMGVIFPGRPSAPPVRASPVPK